MTACRAETHTGYWVHGREFKDSEMITQSHLHHQPKEWENGVLRIEGLFSVCLHAQHVGGVNHKDYLVWWARQNEDNVV